MKADRLMSDVQVSRLVTLSDPKAINKSGMEPVETKCLILTDQVATKSAGGIELPPEVLEKQTYAVTTGRLVAAGSGAFADWIGDSSTFPKVGDRVYIAKYAGFVIDGKDGQKYRLIQDKDIAGREI